jgi:ribosomal protein L3 glutamine methyltransferase
MNNNTYAEALLELQTLGDFLRWAVTEFERVPVFYGHGADNAWDEALMLILPTLCLPPVMAQYVLNSKLLRSEKEKLAELIHLRTHDRMPTAYLTRQAWFAGEKYYVDERVLIPRSPLAELIEQQFAPWISEDYPVNAIVDIGTGSGCIACACALAFPDAQVDAVDISPDALAVAKNNVEQHKLQSRVHLIRSNVFSELKNKRYDIIVSNPPYVDAEEMADLPPEYHHEPRLGLAAGQDGLDCLRLILKEAGKHLTTQGILVVEVGFSAPALAEAFPDIPFTWVELERGGEGVFVVTAADL